MYPVREVMIDSSIPANADYWVPKPSDIDDEGYGCYFRDVWPLVGVSTKEAKAVIEWERKAAQYVTRRSASEVEFEALAEAIEGYSPEGDDGDTFIPQELSRNWAGLGGLDLGVSGLAHALSNAGFYPAASCRTHIGHSWSDRPVILFASDHERLVRLQPFIQRAYCGLHADASRGKPLFAVYSRSILELMELASTLFEHRVEFRSLPKRGRRSVDAGRTVRRGTEDEPRLF